MGRGRKKLTLEVRIARLVAELAELRKQQDGEQTPVDAPKVE